MFPPFPNNQNIEKGIKEANPQLKSPSNGNNHGAIRNKIKPRLKIIHL